MRDLNPGDHDGARDVIPNPFALVNVIVKRARQLAGGAEPVVYNPRDVNHNCPAGTAIREIRDGRITLL